MSQKILEKYLWLNSNFFEDALRQQKGDDSIFVKTFDVTSGITNRNQSYWCDIIRLEINYTNSLNELKCEYISLKIGFQNPYMDDRVEKYNPFKRELFFHRDLMPKITELLLSVDDNAELTKKVITTGNERPAPKYLMFEELSQNFEKVDRRAGLDVKHLKVVLKHLAKLHAASAALPDETFSNHQQPNISEYFKVFHSLFVNCVKSLVDEVTDELFEDAAELVKKLSAFESFMIDKSSEAFMLQPDDFGVLCHGDLWLNNLWFTYDDDSIPVDVRMVDFGLSYFGSPAIDLAYLLFTSSCDDVKDYEIDVLLQFYHRELHANLIKFNYTLPIPSLIQMHNSFLKCGVIGFVYSCLLLPLRFADSTSMADLSCLVLQSEEALKCRKELFSDRFLKKRLEFLLNYFDRKGFLE